jgi:putative endonuclease
VSGGPSDRARKRSERARRSHDSGVLAEWAAILLLIAKGYRLMARRHGGKGGEIDLIMRRGRTVIFVEVKARAALDDAMSAVTAEKQRLMRRQVARWRAANPWAADRNLRADAVFIGRGAWPRHVENLFALE